jgi:hypothetical protein
MSDPIQETNRSSAPQHGVAGSWILVLVVRSLAQGIVTVMVVGGPGRSYRRLLLSIGCIFLPIAPRWWIPPEYDLTVRFFVSNLASPRNEANGEMLLRV